MAFFFLLFGLDSRVVVLYGPGFWITDKRLDEGPIWEKAKTRTADLDIVFDIIDPTRFDGMNN